MTAVEPEQPDTYPWRAAPSHLKTRRQLRDMGLSPNAEPTARMVREATGRKRRRLWAHLFDTRLAAPKRTATPAQMEAVAKAVRGRQIRAAERRGITVEGLTQPADPGPAWTGTPEKEEITMSDTFTDPNDDRTQAALDADTLDDERRFYEDALGDLDIHHEEARAIHMADPTAIAETFVDNRPERAQRLEKSLDRLEAELDQHLRTHRETLATDPIWGPRVAEQKTKDTGTQPRLGEATEPGQRLAQLHALMAVNRARYDRDQLSQAHASDEWRQKLGQRAARWQGTVPWQRSREALPQALADALIWREEDDRSRQMVEDLVEHYRSGWGVVIDADALTVQIDPAFDPAPVQQFDEAAALWSREAAALDIVSAAPLIDGAKDAAIDALTDWTASWNTEGGSRTYVETRDQRRAQLRRTLNTLLSESDRARVEFTVDYLSGDVAGVDLLDTPTVVDPGEEVRGRIPMLLESFAAERLSPQGMGEEISVMTAADQDKVRSVGREIVAGRNPDLAVWPGYVDRDQVLTDLRQYATDAAEQYEVADWITENDVSGESPEMFGVGDENEARLLRMDEARNRLHDIAAAPGRNGLASMERALLDATLADIDTGRIRGEKDLPVLVWADDRTRGQIDEERQFEAGSHIGRDTCRSVEKIVASTGREFDERQQTALSAAVAGVGDAISSVATGPGLETLDTQRHRYSEKVRGLGEALARAGIDGGTKQRVREVVDHNARTAGKFGRATTEREQRWKTRTEQVVSARDDAIAQRQAADAGRAPRQSRNCATRTERGTKPGTPAPTRAAGRRQLHSDLGR